MPTHCCVPECTKKGCREDDGRKVSFFKFPDHVGRRKQWLHAIRREEGKHFRITKGTKVCSRHFRPEYDFVKTLAGRTELRGNAVPSKFAWTRTSPRKRKVPAVRESIDKTSRNPFEETGTNDEPENSENCVDEGENRIEERETVESILSENLKMDAETQTTEPKEGTETSPTQQIVDLESNLERAKRRIESLQNQVFTIERFQSSDASIHFYTGFPNWKVFMSVFRYLNPGDMGENITYWLSSRKNVSASVYEELAANGSKKGRSRSLRPIDEYFLVMCRLRQGFPEEHLSHLFDISTSTVSRIFISWINFMYLRLGQLNIWPTRQVINETMPEDFKQKYSSTRVIIDCTEVRCQMPSSLHLNGELFSNYKHHTTLKGLIGISPGGAITFISQLYTGSISDREIVVRSGLLDLPLQDGDSVMADKGFTIEDLLPLGVSLNIPPFLGSSNQMPAQDVVRTQEIASLRIHVERAINKIKNFHIWDGVVPLHQFGVVNQMWAVCAILCNAQPNIISI